MKPYHERSFHVHLVHACKHVHRDVCTGEITVPGLQDQVREAASHKRVPTLLALRKELRSILRSNNGTIASLCSPAGSVDPQLLATTDSMRKNVMAHSLLVGFEYSDWYTDVSAAPSE